MKAHQRGDLKQLRLLVTEGIFQGLERELKSQPPNELRSAFEVLEFSRPANVVQIRHGENKGAGYGQVTALVQSKRRVVKVDAKGRIAGGGEGEGKLLDIPTFCVFETCFKDPRATWRLARIDEFGATEDPRSTIGMR